MAAPSKKRRVEVEKGEDPTFWETSSDDGNEEGIGGSDVFVVERILGKRTLRDGTVQYHIKWQGYPMKDATWEAEEDADCQDLIDQFERERLEKARKAEARKEEFRMAEARLKEARIAEMKREEALNAEKPRPRIVPTKIVAEVEREDSPPMEEPLNEDAYPVIMGITEKRIGERVFLVRFSDGQCSLVEMQEANGRWPQQVIRFYESKIITSGKKKNTDLDDEIDENLSSM